MSTNSFHTRATLTVGSERFDYFSLPALEAMGFPRVGQLPYSLTILLENLLRREDGSSVKPDDIRALASWQPEWNRQNRVHAGESCCRTLRASRVSRISLRCATASRSSAAIDR
jgi:aconitase A